MFNFPYSEHNARRLRLLGASRPETRVGQRWRERPLLLRSSRPAVKIYIFSNVLVKSRIYYNNMHSNLVRMACSDLTTRAPWPEATTHRGSIGIDKIAASG